MNNFDCIIIIFGISGDLSKRMLLPGIYYLMRDKKIHNFFIIGVGLEQTTLSAILDQAKPFIQDHRDEIIQQLIDRMLYLQLDIQKEAGIEQLAASVVAIEQKTGISHRLVYCATPSTLFAIITKKLCEHAILQKKEQNDLHWHRIAFEKPFGHDLQSARRLNKQLLTLLHEHQLYRIDHYLAKEVVENILYLRFTNHIFESLWYYKHIESVHILLAESQGIAGRGVYYDQFGALRDVVQNHMLQLLAIVAMEPPASLAAHEIRNRKAAVLKKTMVLDGILGQYKGYHNEHGVKADSTTESFASLTLAVNTKRWKGVPFYLTTGKYLTTKKTTITVKFKDAVCTLTPKNCPLASNYLTIELFPIGGFSFVLNAKKPSVRDAVIPVKMDFCYECLFVPTTPLAYENLLLDIIRGDQTISVRFDEIELSWRIIDQIEKQNLPLSLYDQGTDGPKK